MQIKEYIKKFWAFLKEDTWQSWIVSLILIVIFIKVILFPMLSLLTGTPLPLVIVESCSMYHSTNFDDWWNKNGAWYESNGIEKSEFEKFPLKNGLNKGDILIVIGKTNVGLGDIIIFEAGSKFPLIHRVVSLEPIGTKGDNNIDQLRRTNNLADLDETSIQKSQIIGEAKFKILPLLGWIKLIWFEPFKSSKERGFCK